MASNKLPQQLCSPFDGPNQWILLTNQAVQTFMAQIAKQLAEMVPLTVSRKNRLLSQRFHDLEKARTQFKDWFDIDACTGMKQDECDFAAKMFHRRHVYEHNGGEVDQRYLDVSNDTTVRLKQHIRET